MLAFPNKGNHAIHPTAGKRNFLRLMKRFVLGRLFLNLPLKKERRLSKLSKCSQDVK